jgi:hypothetical protein
LIPKAISLLFEGFDFIIEAFQRSGENTVAEIGQQPGTMAAKGFCQLEEVREIE